MLIRILVISLNPVFFSEETTSYLITVIALVYLLSIHYK
jgi:hypothetical protein